MKNPERSEYQTWQNLIEFLFPDDASMTLQEVEAELQDLGIDPRPGFAKVQQALKRMAAPREANLQSELEQLFGWVGGAAQRVWKFLGLEDCPRLEPALGGQLGHVGDQEDGESGPDEGKDVPISEEIRAQLPWLDKVQIVVIDQGETSDRRRYGARVSVIEHAPAPGGRLYVALVEKDGPRSGCTLSNAEDERGKPFNEDFSADWRKLTVVMASEV